MNVLIVHAHPEPKSFSSALYLEAKRFFEEKGDSVQVSDLYAMDFNPVASSEDFAERADPDYFNYALELQALSRRISKLKSKKSKLPIC
jgi:NAD(P)H dehydrogenase (quinone)